MKLVKIFLLSAIVICLGACSTLNYRVQNREKAHLKARSIAPTKIPPGLASNGFRNYYPVSLKSYPESEKQVSIVPPGLPGAA